MDNLLACDESLARQHVRTHFYSFGANSQLRTRVQFSLIDAETLQRVETLPRRGRTAEHSPFLPSSFFFFLFRLLRLLFWRTASFTLVHVFSLFRVIHLCARARLRPFSAFGAHSWFMSWKNEIHSQTLRWALMKINGAGCQGMLTSQEKRGQCQVTFTPKVARWANLYVFGLLEETWGNPYIHTREATALVYHQKKKMQNDIISCFQSISFLIRSIYF